MVSLAQPDAVNRATAADPKELTRQQAAVAVLAVEPAIAWRLNPSAASSRKPGPSGARVGLDPTLILAIMAVESSFNPFAQSSPWARKGLMQVMTRVHDDKYEAFGGNHAAFDPVTNLRVGVQVLKECIARAGSVDAGLRYYVGAANATDDGGYAGKVLGEQSVSAQHRQWPSGVADPSAQFDHRCSAAGRGCRITPPVPAPEPRTHSAEITTAATASRFADAQQVSRCVVADRSRFLH